MASTEDPRVGRVIDGRYRILERLATGAMGVVYRAERLELGRTVAIKFLLDAFASDPRRLEHFEREARAMSKLTHPHCVPVIDFGVADAPYLVMEFASGRTLWEALRKGPFEWTRAADITIQVLRGLAHAHQRGIVHRDIKPANLMLSEATGVGEHVRILDFGLAKLRDPSLGGEPSAPTLLAGTPQYMAPEQWSSEPVDGRADLYSVGIVLFEMVAGGRPFQGTDPLSFMRAHTSVPPPRLIDINRELPMLPGLEAVIAKALAKRPRDRYRDATAFIDALNELLASAGAEQGVSPSVRPSVSTKPVDTPRATARKPARRSGGVRVVLWALTLTVMALGASRLWPALQGVVSEPRPGEGDTSGDAALAPPGPTAAPVPAQPAEALAPAAAHDAADAAQPPDAGSPATDEPSPPLGLGVAPPPIPPPPAPTPAPTPTPTPTPAPTPPQDAAVGAPPAAPEQEAPASPSQEAEGERAASPAAGRRQQARAPAEGTPGDGQPSSPDSPAAAAEPGAAEESAEQGAAEPAAVPESEPAAEPESEAESEAEAEAQVRAEPAAPPAPEAVVAGPLAQVKRDIAAGRRERALLALQALRRKRPRDAQLPYLIGTIYYDKGWWSAAYQRYGEALRLDRRYRARRDINEHLIRGLGSKSTYRTARQILRRDVGKAALPHLRRAAASDRNPTVRQRARVLYDELQRR